MEEIGLQAIRRESEGFVSKKKLVANVVSDNRILVTERGKLHCQSVH